MKRILAILLAGALALALFPQPAAVQAARGLPGSSEFGYGGSLYLNSAGLSEGVQLAKSLGLDWIRVNLSWKDIQPQKDGALNWAHVDHLVQLVSGKPLAILGSLVNPPDWSLTATGPDPNHVSRFVAALEARYSNSIKALEIFPGANTRRGWNAKPDPALYVALIKAIKKNLGNAPIAIIAGGLLPAFGSSADSAVDDLKFLDGMYAAGLKDVTPVISIQLMNPGANHLAAPQENQHQALRHYEEIRAIMQKNAHNAGLIWITRLGLPQDFTKRNNQAEADWLNLAYTQIRSQLYIGVAIFDALNKMPAEQGLSSSNISLLLPDNSYHPAVRTLRNQILQNAPAGLQSKPGRPKSDKLTKQR